MVVQTRCCCRHHKCPSGIKAEKIDELAQSLLRGRPPSKCYARCHFFRQSRARAINDPNASMKQSAKRISIRFYQNFFCSMFGLALTMQRPLHLQVQGQLSLHLQLHWCCANSGWTTKRRTNLQICAIKSFSTRYCKLCRMVHKKLFPIRMEAL